jgi:hypothetical protein
MKKKKMLRRILKINYGELLNIVNHQEGILLDTSYSQMILSN